MCLFLGCSLIYTHLPCRDPTHTLDSSMKDTHSQTHTKRQRHTLCPKLTNTQYHFIEPKHTNTHRDTHCVPDVHKTHRHTPLLSSSQTLWQDTPSDHPTKRATHTAAAAAGGTIPHTLNHVRHTHTQQSHALTRGELNTSRHCVKTCLFLASLPW